MIPYGPYSSVEVKLYEFTNIWVHKVNSKSLNASILKKVSFKQDRKRLHGSKDNQECRGEAVCAMIRLIS